MVHRGVPRLGSACLGSLRRTKAAFRLPWCTAAYQGCLQTALVYRGEPRLPSDCLGSPRRTKAAFRLPWFTAAYQGCESSWLASSCIASRVPGAELNLRGLSRHLTRPWQGVTQATEHTQRISIGDDKVSSKQLRAIPKDSSREWQGVTHATLMPMQLLRVVLHGRLLHLTRGCQGVTQAAERTRRIPVGEDTASHKQPRPSE